MPDNCQHLYDVAYNPTRRVRTYGGCNKHGVCYHHHVCLDIHHVRQPTYTTIMFVVIHVGCDLHDVGTYMM